MNGIFLTNLLIFRPCLFTGQKHYRNPQNDRKIVVSPMISSCASCHVAPLSVDLLLPGQS